MYLAPVEQLLIGIHGVDKTLKRFPRLPSLIPGTVTMRRQHTHDDVKLHDKRDCEYVIQVTNLLALTYTKGRLYQGLRPIISAL